ncbi:MAG: bifunctional aldolase/short-chain dehydrogenase [Microbacteriaceae bacterium]|nr:bifunctional aldolase/short-chain dehydrogenase [Microbacteriaceae bacterium]
MVDNRWVQSEAPADDDLIAQRVYTSQLLGRDPRLVLHGGGNTSVKLARPNIFGETEELIFVKGSGWDLSTIEAPGFAPLLAEPVRRLSELRTLTDIEMARQLNRFKVEPEAPSPSVEAILHALLPFAFVDHTHADAVVTLTNTVQREDLVREVFGSRVVIVPYVMPGFDLAQLVASRLDEFSPATEGMILMNHGIFTFGGTARESYDRMIDLVNVAENAIPSRAENRAPNRTADVMPAGPQRREVIATLRSKISSVAGRSCVLTVSDDADSLAFAQRADVDDVANRGPATPDHVIRTKPTPLVGRDVDGFAQAYTKYFDENAARARVPVLMLDAAPRVVIDRELGVLTSGRSVAETLIAADIYRHTISIINSAELMGGYRTLNPQDVFDVEYWDLEQAKLKLAGPTKPLAGQVALVTGAASGIGKSVAEHLLSLGAAVVGLDLNPDIANSFLSDAWLGVPCDITDAQAVSSALDRGVNAFGGLDIGVVNAGIFPPAKPVAELSTVEWQSVMRVNVDSAFELLRECHPLLRLSHHGARVIVVGSKNVVAPGPGVAAYSASKAALTQLARVLAMEWASDRIRVNVIHPDAVFDTGLWANGVVEARAAHYGLSVEEYRRRNLLGVEIFSADVALLVGSLVSPAFDKTTGAQIPIDGGNDRVI